MLQITYDFETRPYIYDKEESPESCFKGAVRVTVDDIQVANRLVHKTEIMFEESDGAGASNQILKLFLQANAAELVTAHRLAFVKTLERCPIPTVKLKGEDDNRGGDYGLIIKLTLVELREVTHV